MSRIFRSVDRGGRSVRYVCMGSGEPAVVIDQGQGLSIERGFERWVTAGWSRVLKEVSKATQVVMHDRAGLGSSEPAALPRSSMQMVEDLRAVLAAAHVPPPYVLVGHSIGGFNVRVFAGKYPDEVSGVVLVDSSHPDQVARWAQILPPEVPDEPLLLRRLRHGPSIAASPECIDFRACAEQARAVTTLGRKPLVVVSHSPHSLAPPGMPVPLHQQMQPLWSRLQSELLGLSANSTHVVASHAGHNVQLEEPELVVHAILDVVREAQRGGPRLH